MNNLTEGKIFNKLMLFALPMIAGNLLQQIYNIVDTIVVGRFVSADALAAVGSSYTLMIFITSIIIGLCMGSGALFSKSYGANKINQMKQDIYLSFIFISTITIIIYIIIYLNIDNILKILSIPGEIYDLTKNYLLIIFIGIAFTYFYNFFAYTLRSIGNSFIPLVFLAISAIINIILDLYFVISLNYGVEGTAMATVIAQAIAAIGITTYSLLKHKNLFITDHKLVYNQLKYIIKNDFFTALQQSIMNLGILMIQGLVNSFGTTIMAAFAVAVKIDTLAYMPAQEFGNAYSLFISSNYGAKKKERIKDGSKIAVSVSVIFCLTISLIIWIFAKDFMQIFVDKNETTIILEGIKYLRIEGSFYFGIGILFLLYGYFRAIQYAQMSLILTIISLGTRVLLSYLLAPNTFLGVYAIWFSIPIGWILADIVGYINYRKNIKKLQF